MRASFRSPEAAAACSIKLPDVVFQNPDPIVEFCL